MARSTLLALLLALSVLPTVSRAESPEKARLHFKEGKRLSALNNHVAALAEFDKARLAAERPNIVFMIAYEHKQLAEAGDEAHIAPAVEAFRRYLVLLPAAPDRADVENSIAKLESRRTELAALKRKAANAAASDQQGNGAETGGQDVRPVSPPVVAPLAPSPPSAPPSLPASAVSESAVAEKGDASHQRKTLKWTGVALIAFGGILAAAGGAGFWTAAGQEAHAIEQSAMNDTPFMPHNESRLATYNALTVTSISAGSALAVAGAVFLGIAVHKERSSLSPRVMISPSSGSMHLSLQGEF